MGASIQLALNCGSVFAGQMIPFPQFLRVEEWQNICSFPELKCDSSSKLHNPENDPSNYYLSSFKYDT